MKSRLAVGLSVVIKQSDELSIQMGLFAVPVTSPNGRRGVAFAGSSARGDLLAVAKKIYPASLVSLSKSHLY